MAAQPPDKNLLEMIFEFYCPPSKSLQINEINKLTIDDQLNLIQFDRISSIKQRKELTISLYDTLPDLKATAYKRIRFKSILSSFYKTYIELQSTAPQTWSQTQLPLSLFVYLIKGLQKPDVTEKDKKSAVSSWKFVFFTLKYCTEESFDGEKLHVFYNEVTNNGTKTGGFGLKFVQKICNKYSLKFGKFAKVKKKVGVWYTDSLKQNISAMDDVKQSENNYKQQEGSKSSKIQDKKPVQQSIKSPPKAEYVASGAKWYWMDMEELEWIPYRDIDQQVLNQAYANKAGKCDVVNGKYRVEFDVGSAAGNQFENNIADPINHMVVRAEPEDGEIHGMCCAQKPK